MVDALGLTKHEGVYRSVCELTLHVLRENRDTLMSVLETFIYDPLLEWVTKTSRGRASAVPKSPFMPAAFSDPHARVAGGTNRGSRYLRAKGGRH